MAPGPLLFLYSYEEASSSASLIHFNSASPWLKMDRVPSWDTTYLYVPKGKLAHGEALAGQEKRSSGGGEGRRIGSFRDLSGEIGFLISD